MLTLVPASRELMPFRQALLADPATMSYNAPWSPPDGTILFPPEGWDSWLARWSNHEPERFCGYVTTADGAPVGEVCWYDHGAGMGVVIHHSCRGRGYGAEALQLLIRRAFSHPEILRLENRFESSRTSAMRAHLEAGFAVTGTDANGCSVLTLTRAAHCERQLRRLTQAMCRWEAGKPEQIHHFIKVHSFARQIGQMEGLGPDPLFILEAAALTHDIGIRPAVAMTGACPGPLQEELGPPEAEAMLQALHFPPEVIRRVCFLIARHHTTDGVDSPDWQILLEADFLVNMIEGHLSDEAIDTCRSRVFRTAEGLRLLDWIRPFYDS